MSKSAAGGAAAANAATTAATGSPPAVVVRDLKKSYGDVHAVRGLSFEVAAGEVFALLGPNGAGKSTTVEILEGHRTADSGEVSVLGFDPAARKREFRDRIGIVLQESSLHTVEITVIEALDLFGRTYRRRRDRDEVIELVGLQGKENARIKTLSGGQQRRVDVALALIGDPDLVFLDEPTTGFDPAARRASWEMVAGLRSLGRTVILTSHYMDEVEYLADRMAVVVHGRIVACDVPSRILGVPKSMIKFRWPDGASQADLPEEVADELTVAGGWAALNTHHATRLLAGLTGWAAARGTELEELTVNPPNLEDSYLELVATASTEDGSDVG